MYDFFCKAFAPTTIMGWRGDYVGDQHRGDYLGGLGHKIWNAFSSPMAFGELPIKNQA